MQEWIYDNGILLWLGFIAIMPPFSPEVQYADKNLQAM